MWVEVLRTGSHTASDGRRITFTVQHLDHIVKSYDHAQHEAPIVIGHPQDNAPAYGRVDALKRDGEHLKAKLKDLAPEFLEVLKKGLFKKRSISLYPDLSLRHIGFLGAMPPSVKGLADIQLKEGVKRMTTIEFTEGKDKSAGERLNEKVAELLKKQPKYDRSGRPLERPLSFSDAFNWVCQDCPDLAEQYAIEIHSGR